jgi:hypothetical protein
LFLPIAPSLPRMYSSVLSSAVMLDSSDDELDASMS